MANPMTLTIADLLAGYDRHEWNHFGYLGGRRHAISDSDPDVPAQPEQVADADALVVATANRRGWSAEDLFHWSNSKHGRWLADALFGGATGHHLQRAIAAHLTSVALEDVRPER